MWTCPTERDIMALSVGTLVKPFIDASYFANETYTNFQCTGDKTDSCVGIITGFLKDQKVYAMVKWVQRCETHKQNVVLKNYEILNIDDLWEIGQI